MTDRPSRHGRDPEHVKITQLVNIVAAATKMEAEDKWALIEKLPLEIDGLSLLSEALNFDFATKGMDDAFRMGKTHMEDVKKVVDVLAERAPIPIYLVGTSRFRSSVHEGRTSLGMPSGAAYKVFF